MFCFVQYIIFLNSADYCCCCCCWAAAGHPDIFLFMITSSLKNTQTHSQLATHSCCIDLTGQTEWSEKDKLRRFRILTGTIEEHLDIDMSLLSSIHFMNMLGLFWLTIISLLCSQRHRYLPRDKSQNKIHKKTELTDFSFDIAAQQLLWTASHLLGEKILLLLSFS